MIGAYAVRITPANKWAIASEHPKFDEAEFDKWLDEHDGGYFLRDPESVFDCRYFDEVLFSEFYKIEFPESDELFLKVQKRR